MTVVPTTAAPGSGWATMSTWHVPESKVGMRGFQTLWCSNSLCLMPGHHGNFPAPGGDSFLPTSHAETTSSWNIRETDTEFAKNYLVFVCEQAHCDHCFICVNNCSAFFLKHWNTCIFFWSNKHKYIFKSEIIFFFTTWDILRVICCIKISNPTKLYSLRKKAFIYASVILRRRMKITVKEVRLPLQRIPLTLVQRFSEKMENKHDKIEIDASKSA